MIVYFPLLPILLHITSPSLRKAIIRIQGFKQYHNLLLCLSLQHYRFIYPYIYLDNIRILSLNA